MANPQENMKNGVLTQYSDDLSDLTSGDEVKDRTRNELTLPNGEKIITGKPHFETLPWTSSSSSPSLTSPGSASTKTDKTYITQVDEVVAVDKVVSPPAAKRQLAFSKENDNPQPQKKPKGNGVKCCGRCGEFKMICLEMADSTNDALKRNYQYKVSAKNSKYRAIFYQVFQDKTKVAQVPVCVLEYARSLYPSPIGK